MAKSDAAATCHTEAVRTWAGEEEKKFQVITFFIYIFCWHLNSLWWPACPNDRRMNHSFCASIQAFIHAIVQGLPLRETDVLSVRTWSSRPRRAYCRSQTRKQFVCEKSPSKQKQQSKSVANEFIRSDLHLPVNGIHSNAFTRLPVSVHSEKTTDIFCWKLFRCFQWRDHRRSYSRYITVAVVIVD